MNNAHLHLLVTHLPIIGLFFSLGINLYSIFKKSAELKCLTLWSYVILGLFAIIAYATGDGAEKIIETYPGMKENIIEPHENWALFFFIGLMLLSGIALIGVIMKKYNERMISKIISYLIVLALIVSVLGIKTGITGGIIRHTEIKDGANKTGIKVREREY